MIDRQLRQYLINFQFHCYEKEDFVNKRSIYKTYFSQLYKREGVTFSMSDYNFIQFQLQHDIAFSCLITYSRNTRKIIYSKEQL